MAQVEYELGYVDVMERLRELQGAGTQRDLARRLKVSSQYLCDVFNGERNPGPKIIRALGLRAVMRYVVDNGRRR